MDCTKRKIIKRLLIILFFVITIIVSVGFYFIYQYNCIKCVYHVPGLNHGVYVVKIDMFNNVTAEFGTRNTYDNFSSFFKLKDEGFGYSKVYSDVSEEQDVFISDFRRLWDEEVFITNENAYNHNDTYVVEIKYKGKTITDEWSSGPDANQRFINGIFELSSIKKRNAGF